MKTLWIVEREGPHWKTYGIVFYSREQAREFARADRAVYGVKARIVKYVRAK